MKDDLFERYQRSKFDKGLTRETVKARYENLNVEKQIEEVVPKENLADIKIKMAMAAGEFDNLSGKGKPIDFSKYNDVPEHLRTAYQIMKNSGYVPEEVRLKKKMGLLQEKMKESEPEEEKKEMMKQLTRLSQEYNFCMENNRRLKK